MTAVSLIIIAAAIVGAAGMLRVGLEWLRTRRRRRAPWTQPNRVTWLEVELGRVRPGVRRGRAMPTVVPPRWWERWFLTPGLPRLSPAR